MKVRAVVILTIFFTGINAFDTDTLSILGGIVYPGSIVSRELEQELQRLAGQTTAVRAVYDFETITTPGIYILAGNVSNQITISVSNVTLDMNGHTVSGGTNGIVINGGLSNITIKNGVIDTVTGDGIQVNSGCSAITIRDVTVKNATRGILYTQVMNGTIERSDFNNNGTGLQLDTSRNIMVKGCMARACTDTAYDLTASTTCSVIECAAFSTGSGNSDTTATIFGFVSNNGNGNLFEKCRANSTQGLLATDSDSIIAGFALRGSESCSKIIGCEASSSQASVDGLGIPHGILIEGTLSVAVVVSEVVSIADGGRSSTWSPCGKYGIMADDNMQLIRFDRKAQTATVLATDPLGTDGFGVDWSPNGRYIAAGGTLTGNDLRIYRFDPYTETITQIASALTGTVRAVAWSPDGQYLAIAGISITGGTAGDEFQIFRFDTLTETLTSVTGGLTGTLLTTDWSSDNEHIVVSGSSVTGGTGDTMQVLRFDRALEQAVAVAGFARAVTAGAWSSDGQYIATGAGDLIVFRFDAQAQTITQVASASSGTVRAVAWSPDGQYVLVAVANVRVYRFDRTAGTLTQVGSMLSSVNRNSASWSPDGEYLIGSNAIGTGIQFPQNNLIKDNTVYCNSGGQYPSGVGISGSSISNQIIGNTAFNNPIPRAQSEPLVVTNYYFVTNVFNQLFGDAPTALQNSSLSGIDPILNRYDIPTQLFRLQALAESLIDNLL